jgi:F-type H+-transporting ATPase subunit alpha
MEQQVMIMYAVINGYMDDVAIENVKNFEREFQRFLQSNHPEVGQGIRESGELDEAGEQTLAKIIGEFRQAVPM